MLKTEYCSLSDIPEAQKRGCGQKPGTINRSKWWRTINTFLKSGEEVCKITPDDISARNCSISLAQYLRHHDYPIAYAQRGNSVYIFRKAEGK